MRWIGPYGGRREWIDAEHHPNYTEQARPYPPQPDFHIEAWRVRSRNSAVTHVMSVSWPAESRLQLRFGGGAVACAADGCSVTDDPGTPTAQAGPASPEAIPHPSEALTSPGVASHQRNAPVGRQRQRPVPFIDYGVVPPPSAQWRAVGDHGNGSAAANRYLLYDNTWHPSVWPPGDTLVFYLSTVNWPEDARMTPEEVKDLLSEMLAEWSDISTADMLLRVDGPVDLEPGRDGKNIFFLNPGSVHGGGVPTYWSDRIDGVRGIVEVDHELGLPENVVWWTKGQYDQSPWLYVANAMGMHPLGHTFGLGHSAAFPVARSCPPPTYGVDDCGPVDGDSGYWRRVSGAWPLDPIMSYGISSILSWTADGRTLRLDDKVGASLLRPRPGWLATVGTIAGSVRAEDGWPVSHVHIWAVRPSDDGTVDGVGAFADRDGNFEIRGLPPGDWFLVAHPDLEWLANPGFYYDQQGELLDEMLLYPVRAQAGQTADGIEITMSRGRSATTPGTGR